MFATLALIYMIRFPFLSLPMALNAIIAFRVTMRRTEALLGLSELPVDQVGIALTPRDVCLFKAPVSVLCCSFSSMCSLVPGTNILALDLNHLR